MIIQSDIYTQNGYNNRTDYLKQLSNSYGLPYHLILELSDTLGSVEDFDALLIALNDIRDSLLL